MNWKGTQSIPNYPNVACAECFLPFGLRQETQKEDEVWATDFIAADLKETWGQSLFSLVFCACDWPTDSPTEATSFSVLYKAEFALPKCELRSWKSLFNIWGHGVALMHQNQDWTWDTPWLSFTPGVLDLPHLLYFLRAEHGDVPRGSKFFFCNVHLQAFAGFPCTIPKTPCRTDAEAGASFFLLALFHTLPYCLNSLHRVSILCHIRHARIRSACRLRTVRFDLRSALQSLAFQS